MEICPKNNIRICFLDYTWWLECDFIHDDFGADVGEHRRAGEELEEEEK